MHARPVVAAAAVLSLLALPAVDAAAKARPQPKPICNVLTDASGDANWHLVPVVNPPTLDVISGDLATGPKTLVGVLRLQSTDFAHDSYRHLGYSWTFGATSTLGTEYGFRAALDPITDNLTSSATVDNQSVPVKFSVVGNALVWTIDRKVSPALSRPKNVFIDFRGGSQIASSTADTAFTKGTKYPDRARSCVPAK